MTQQPQPPAGWFLDPAREEQVREWAAKLGASTNMDSVGPYSALCDALAEIDRLRTELQQAQQQLNALATVKVWRNEDGREFLFAGDVRTAMGITAAASGCGCQTRVHPGHYPSCTAPAAVSGA